MLLTLLPGIRELRTPLAIGYIYLLTLTILLKGSVPRKEDATGPLQSIYEIAEWLGKPALLGISAFAAYLIGSILQVHGGSIFGLQARIVVASMRTPAWQFFQKRKSEKHLREIIGREMETTPTKDERLRFAYGPVARRRRNIEVRVEGGDTHILRSGGVMGLATLGMLAVYVHDRVSGTGIRWGEAYSTLTNDFTTLRTRLLVASKDLYGDYDRLSAEADFKVNVGISGVVLSSITGATLDDTRWLAVWVPMAILITRGLKALREATSVMAQAIIAEVVKSPKFEALLGTAETRQNDGYR
ncbi:hypothetical protein ABZ867_27535 [Streptomyces cinnamoneus]